MAKVWYQHAGAFTACLSAFAVGNALGWSAPAGPQLRKGAIGFPVTEKENSLISSLLTLGAAVSSFPTGCVMNKIGRKYTLLGVVPIFLLGWSLLIWATSVVMIYVSRFLLGLCVGAVCVAVPVYVAEISQKEIRGAIGSYFQITLTAGIFFSYVIGSNLSVFWFSLICSMVPLVFGLTFVFFPETPVYYLTKGCAEKARKSILFFHGLGYDSVIELDNLSGYSPETDCKINKSLWNIFKTKRTLIGLTLSVGLMVFQQASGVNAFVFNATHIFQSAESTLDTGTQTIIIGSMQVIGAFIVLFLVDKIGRVKLLEISALCMSIFTFLLGLYFFCKEKNFRTEDFAWVPLFSLCAFILFFSVGFGTIPWILVPELMPSAVRGPATSLVSIANWLTAFAVTAFYSDLVKLFGRGVTFWIFSVISITAVIFSFSVVPETKGKSLDEIQRQLAGEEFQSEDPN